MRERSEQVLRIICLVLGALLILQLSLHILRRDPLAKLQIPPLPSLTDAPETQPSGKGTNLVAARTASKSGTNALANNGAATSSVALAPVKGATNLASTEPRAENTNAGTAGPIEASGLPASETVRDPSAVVSARGSNAAMARNVTDLVGASSNLLAHSATGRSASRGAKPDTNSTKPLSAARNGTNLLPHSDLTMGGMGPPGRFGQGPKPKDLPPPIQARVDRITESELLGPVMRPLPMALLGIAGDVAFIRGANGQTGLVKAGDKLGELKLLRIGVNRVLVEDEGEKKELTMFSGYGSDSLLPKTQDTPK